MERRKWEEAKLYLLNWLCLWRNTYGTIPSSNPVTETSLQVWKNNTSSEKEALIGGLRILEDKT